MKRSELVKTLEAYHAEWTARSAVDRYKGISMPAVYVLELIRTLKAKRKKKESKL